MRPLFEHTPDERKEETLTEATTTEVLEGLAMEKEELFFRLAELAEQQKALVSEVRAVDRREKEALEGVEEHIAEEPLSHEDVVKWVTSVHAQFARTMPNNAHSYIHTRWTDRAMFERVVRHIREHGYDQQYGGAMYRCYDAGTRFFWTMGAPVEETILINCKPVSMKPKDEDGGEGA